MTKSEIVEVLESIATLLELKGENPFKIRAYQNGARTLETLEEDLDTLIAEDRLKNIKGLGEALVDKIQTLHAEGVLDYYEKLKASVPAGLLEMMEIPGLGGKKIKKLHEELALESMEDLQKAAEDGRIAGLKGFGKKTAENILRGIENRKAYSARHLWWKVEAVTLPILESLKEQPGVEKAEAAGSFRRLRETVGDLDFIVGSNDPEPVMDWFTTMDLVTEITSKGTTKSSVRLKGGLQADLRVVPPAQYPFALHHFTGSKDHNVKMRQRALQRGLSLSEWGLKPEEEDSDVNIPEVHSEKDLFAALDLHEIPPELREGYDELDYAEEHLSPDLLREEDLRGVFHNHTKASDGKASLEEMVQAAQDKGWEYLGIADHSKASFQANGLDEERLEKQVQQIRKLNEEGAFQCHVFTGCEIDIHQDGSLDFEDAFLEDLGLDTVVVSIHSSFTLSEEDQTKRLIKAIENPFTTMVGHLTGRLLLRREPYALNIGKVIDAAAANGVVLELNANPRRLDMDWRYWKQARDKGVLCAINPDAHSTDGLDFTRAGVAIARKGWLTREDVLNTRTKKEIISFLGKK